MDKSIDKTDSRESFYVVYQNKKILFISNGFFSLFDCFSSTDDFLKTHQDVQELFTFTNQTRKFYKKLDDTKLLWYESFIENKQKNNRIIFGYKGIEYYYKFFITQSFSALDQYVIYFHSIDNELKKEKKLVQFFYKTQKKIKKLEKLSKHKDKLTLMGEIMENITHQWKQPLTNILFTATAIQFKKSLDRLNDEELDKSVENIIESVNYMSQTVNDFKSFLNEEKQKRVFEIGEIINKIESIIKGNITRFSIDLEINIEKQLYVFGFENELIQSIVNIINNATDALKSKDPRNRKISMTISQTDSKSIITIKDNGGGVQIDIIDKIFEHYFTTKGENGSGIGLHITKEIVENHFRGELKVYNTEVGAVFEIILPLYEFEEITEI